MICVEYESFSMTYEPKFESFLMADDYESQTFSIDYEPEYAYFDVFGSVDLIATPMPGYDFCVENESFLMDLVSPNHTTRIPTSPFCLLPTVTLP